MTRVKARLQAIAKRAGLYQRLKASTCYDIYWLAVDPRVIRQREAEVSFYRNLLTGFQKGDLILDIGANDGTKANIFLKLGAKVVAVEPDELNQEVLRQRFLKYRFVKRPVEIVGKAVSDQHGLATMWVDEPGSWMNTLNQKWADTLKADHERFGQTMVFGNKREVETVTMEELFTDYGLPFFVKIDVEGHEVKVLQGMRRPVRYLSFEVNLPEFKTEGLECLSRLSEVSPNGEFNFSADLSRGLSLERWLDYKQFNPVFDQRREKSIEVFWRNTAERLPVA